MANIILGGTFLALVLVAARLMRFATIGDGTSERQFDLRACMRAVACSIALILFVWFAYETGGAATNVLPFFLWAYAGFMSVVLGVLGLVGILVLGLLRLLSLLRRAPDKDDKYQ